MVEGLDSVIRQRTSWCMTYWQERPPELSLPHDDAGLQRQPQRTDKKLQEEISEFCKFLRYRITTRKSALCWLLAANPCKLRLERVPSLMAPNTYEILRNLVK